jgi:F0F1-type ATP synthase assembly protein I
MNINKSISRVKRLMTLKHIKSSLVIVLCSCLCFYLKSSLLIESSIVGGVRCSSRLPHFVGLAYQGKDIVFRFIIEYSSLRDFGP